jgi:hypothetical protein
MVNGEDYNNFPFTLYNSIIKSKAVARSSIGTSRYIDLTDITGKYSSTNIFASDGVFYRQNMLPTFDFAWFNVNDIADVINNSIEPVLTSRSMLQFYYANFPRPSLVNPNLNLAWNQSTVLVNECTGFFYSGSVSQPQSIGSYSSSNARYITQGSLIKFIPPAGYYFNTNNRLVAGIPTRADDKLVIWATTAAVILDGTNQGTGNLDNGIGPVTLNNFVPSGAIAELVIPKFVDDLTATFEQSMLQEIQLFRNFGIGYDNLTAEWYIITANNLAADSPFSLAYAQNTSGLNLDASWLLQFVTDGRSYTVTSRGLDYVFASVLQTRFFYDGSYKIYDNRTGSVISDFINVLKVNSEPDSNEPLTGDIVMDIIGQPVQSDGFVNDYEVLVSFRDSDSDGVADDPDFFDEIVAPTVNPNTKFVFLQQTQDFDNLERYLPVEPGVVNFSFATKDAIEVVKAEYLNGQVFYTYSTDQFYQLVISTVNGVLQRELVEIFTFQAKTGRQSLSFQYRHNSPLTNVIDPGATNIIDIYLVISEYYQAYQNYVRDTTGTVPEPLPPTINQLSTAYQQLNDFKMVSDNIVLNSVSFKPLFGAKAAPALQATIKVVRAPKVTASVSEIKSLVVANINEYFTIDKWNFGDSFFFSELAAYLHERMGSIISSVVLVPLNPLKTFGDLYEIRSAPNEIFVSAATVADVEVITALTQSNIRSQTPVAGLYPVTSVGAPGLTIGQTGGGV